MNPADFKVVKSDRWLTAEDFELSPLWGSYYAPEDIDDIVRWGFDEDRVRAALAAADWEDGAVFPLPVEAADTEWMRGKFFAARVTTAGGTVLRGLIFSCDGDDRVEVGLFNAGRQYALGYDAGRLATILGETGIYPIDVVNLVTGDAWRIEGEAELR
jgi:hypothetical protein